MPGYWNAHSDRDWQEECGMGEVEWPDGPYASKAEAQAAAAHAGLAERQYRLARLPCGWMVEPEFFG